MLNVLYRSSDSDKPEVRPEYFSKLKSLENFFRSLEQIDNYTFTLYYDGEPPKEVADIVNSHRNTKIITLDKIGNSASFWQAYQESFDLNPEDWVYFVEDDYLHKLEAISKLMDCTLDVPDADYITLFDHPVRYAADYHYGLDLPHRNNTIFISRNHHWRTQESTCMTFSAQVKTLVADEGIFHKYVKQVPVPEDRELFKRLQGLIGYEKGSPFRLLIGPMPSLATHCDIRGIAPIVDWEKVAKEG